MRFREFKHPLYEQDPAADAELDDRVRRRSTADPAADAELDDLAARGDPAADAELDDRANAAQQAVLSRGDYSGSQEIRQLQTMLQGLGYSVGPPGVDGKFGPYTAAALAAFKQDYGLSGSGDNATQADLDALNSVQSGDTERVATPTQPAAPSGGRYGSNAPPTGPEAGGTAGGPATGGQPGSLEGTAVMAANPDPGALPNQNIIDALDQAANEVGVQVQITPAGGRASRSSGTQNHPPGEAADFQIVQNGNLVTPGQNPQLYDQLISVLVRNATGRGVRPGIGGYGWGIHYDESSWRQGGGTAAGTWNNGYDVSRGVAAGTSGA